MKDTSPLDAAPLSSLACAVFFGSFTFVAVALTIRAAFSTTTRPSLSTPATQRHGTATHDWHWWYQVCWAWTTLGLILFYAYIAEHHPPFPHAEKSYDRDHVFFLTALVLVLAVATANGNAYHGESENKTTTTTMKPTISSLPSQHPTSNHRHHEPHFRSSRRTAVSSGTNEENERNHHSQPQQQITNPNQNNRNGSILNRHQTEEWKGWMQTIFLLYHYFHGVELYNPIRVMITCYVWMTGFGHTRAFYDSADYSIVRMVQILWRLNFLVFWLCVTQGTPYILYYICPLHTLGYVLVYVTMRMYGTNSNVNYSLWGIRAKIMGLAAFIFVVWDMDNGVFRILHSWLFLGQQPGIGAPNGTLWEWYFRSALDHWSILWGMMFALYYPVTLYFWRSVESLPWWPHFIIKTIVGVPLLAATGWWLTGPFHEEKHLYNETHPYCGMIPLLTYIYVRNLTPWLRSHSLPMLQQLGQTTLETYLMQHHIWMTSHSKTLLVLIPGYPQLNCLVVTLLYVGLSRSLFRLTASLRVLLLPKDSLRTGLTNLATLAIAFSACLFVVVSLKETHMLSMTLLGLVSVLGGSLLYAVVMHCTGSSLTTETASVSSTTTLSISPTLAKSSSRSTCAPWPYLIGAITVFALGCSWDWMSRNGASSVQPIPPTCAEAVQIGAWVPVDLCTHEQQGQTRREYGLGSLATCNPSSPTFVWGWDVAAPSSHCRMHRRDVPTILSSLAHRTIVFVGDSILRHTYHAMCRQAGDFKAGAYNTSMGKWGNFSRHYGKLDLEFRWAPYTNDTLVPTLHTILEDEANLPDAIVLGGGAWDQLHRNRDEGDLHRLVDGIRQVADQMRRLREAGVAITWVVPTTINTWGLMTEEKRSWLREDQMFSLRALYKDNGIHDAADFVLEGSSFTQHRVGDSYDGVHYPLEVYDAGAQIILNSFDWLLPPATEDFLEISAPRPGSMAHPLYGFMVMILVLVCLISIDAFAGLEWLACTLVGKADLSPWNMYHNAYAAFHQIHNLPAFQCGEPNIFMSRSINKKKNGTRGIGLKSSDDVEEEITDLVANAITGHADELSTE